MLGIPVDHPYGLPAAPPAPRSVVSPVAISAMCRLAEASPAGAFVEVGVYRGGTAWHLARIARAQGRSLHLYDTFAGMPFQGPADKHRVGDFGDTSLAAVQASIPDAVFHVGDICGAGYHGWVPGRIGFAHIDCDQYDSYRAAIGLFWPCLVSGGIMLFDDYDHLAGARMAVDELLGDRELRWTSVSESRPYVVKP